MKQTIRHFIGTTLVLALSSAPVLANAPGGGYEGITAMYYSFIGLVLAYGVYDIFFKKS